MTFDLEEIIARYEKEIVWASWLYYNTPDGLHSPLSDEEYDARVGFILSNWGLTSKGFRKNTSKEDLRATGYHLKITKAEQKKALEWARMKAIV